MRWGQVRQLIVPVRGVYITGSAYMMLATMYVYYWGVAAKTGEGNLIVLPNGWKSRAEVWEKVYEQMQQNE